MTKFSRNSLQVLAGAAVLLSLFKIQVFFALGSLWGYKYESGSENFSYWAFIVAVWVFCFMSFFFCFLKYPSIRSGESASYLFSFFLLAAHSIWSILDNTKTILAPTLLQQWILIALPALFSVRLMFTILTWPLLMRFSRVFFFLMAIYLTLYFVFPLLNGKGILGLVGASGQTVSYTAATIFGMLLWHTHLEGRYVSAAVFRSAPMRVFSNGLLVSMAVVTVMNGGRGAFLLLLLYVAVASISYIKKGRKNFSIISRASMALCILCISTLFGSALLERVPSLAFGFKRAVAFIGFKNNDQLIDWEGGTSGRGEVYRIAMQGIKDSPWFGHGPFSHWDKITYPHNFFLDLALQFGVIIPVFLLALLLALLWKRVRPWAAYKSWLYMLLLSSVVTVMFSGGYLTQPIMWFCITALLVNGGQARGHQLCHYK